jgi:hypothetical protein
MKALRGPRLWFCNCPANASVSPHSAELGMANGFKFGVFLSHSSKDKVVVRELATRSSDTCFDIPIWNFKLTTA